MNSAPQKEKTLNRVIQNALVRGNRLDLIGDASMELGSLVSIEMIGFWNNRPDGGIYQGKVYVIIIMGRSGIQGALTHRHLWQWLVDHGTTKMDNSPGCYQDVKTFISEGSEPSVALPLDCGCSKCICSITYQAPSNNKHPHEFLEFKISSSLSPLCSSNASFSVERLCD